MEWQRAACSLLVSIGMHLPDLVSISHELNASDQLYLSVSRIMELLKIVL